MEDLRILGSIISSFGFSVRTAAVTVYNLIDLTDHITHILLDTLNQQQRLSTLNNTANREIIEIWYIFMSYIIQKSLLHRV